MASAARIARSASALPQFAAVGLWGLAALVLLFAPFAFFYGLGSAAQTIDARVQDAAQAELAPEIAQRSIPQPVVQGVTELLQRDRLGLNYLTLRNADRVILVSQGDLEDSLTWLGAGQARQWRGFLYRSSSFDRSDVLRLEGEIVGYIDYGIASGAVLAALPLWLWLVVLLALGALPVLIGLFPAAAQYLQARMQVSGVAPVKTAATAQAASARQPKNRPDDGALTLNDELGIGYISVDANGEIIGVNTNAARLLGFEQRRLPGQNLEKLMVLEDGQGKRLVSPLSICLGGARKPAKGSAWLRRRDGKPVGVEMHAGHMGESGKAVAGMLIWEVGEDLAARREDAERANLAQELLQNIDAAVLLVDAGARVLHANAWAQRVFGQSLDALKAMRAEQLLPEPFSGEPLQALSHAPATAVRQDGENLPATLNCVAVRWQSRPAWMLIVLARERHATDRVETGNADALPALAARDSLTGLAGRQHLMQRIKVCLEQQQHCALLLLDIRHFKQINLEFGRETGDRALAQFAHRITEASVVSETFVRLGGDEFAILLASVDQSADQTDEAWVRSQAQAIREACREPVRVDELALDLAIDMGVSLAPDDAGNATDMLQHAEAALYTAKATSAGDPVFFTPGIGTAAGTDKPYARNLHRALAAGKVELRLQPVCPLSAGKEIAGALSSWGWSAPEGDPLQDAELWSLAAELGLIETMTAACVRALAKEYSGWRNLGLTPVPVLLRVPAQIFEDATLGGIMADIMRRYQLPRASLVLCAEDKVAPRTRALPPEIRTAIPTAGKGSTSADFLWASAARVEALPDDENAITELKALSTSARKQGSAVIAGPVASNAQQSALMALDITYGWGPLMGQPMAPRPFARFLAKHQAKGM